MRAKLFVVAASVIGFAGFGAFRLFGGSRVSAQETVGPSAGFVLYAGVRRDTEKNQSFIFFNPKTGEIWAYEDDKVTDHYRLNKLGENLQKLPK